MKRVIYILSMVALLSSCTTEKENSFSFDGEKHLYLTETLTKAKQEDKEVLLYFSSIACVNCRKMEEEILDISKVRRKINKDYIFITLTVDDRTIAEKQYWKKSVFSTDTLKKIGVLNSELQIQLTQSGSQPYFAIMSEDKGIISTIGYTRNEDDFVNFLKKKE